MSSIRSQEPSPDVYDRVVAIGVDMENDFFPPNGSLPVPGGNEVVEPFNIVTSWVRANSGIVILTRDLHPAITSHFAEVPDFKKTWPPHGVKGTEGAEFHPDLTIEPEDVIINKGTRRDEDAFSGFEGTSEDGTTIESIVTPLNYESVAVIIGGLATDYCDLATAVDATKLAKKVRGVIDVFALTDAMRPVNPISGAAALRTMEAAGVILTTTEDVINGKIIELR